MMLYAVSRWLSRIYTHSILNEVSHLIYRTYTHSALIAIYLPPHDSSTRDQGSPLSSEMVIVVHN